MTEKNIITDLHSSGVDRKLTGFDRVADARNKALIKKATDFEFADGTRVSKSDMLTAKNGNPLFSTDIDGYGARIIWAGKDGIIHGNTMVGAKAILPEQP